MKISVPHSTLLAFILTGSSQQPSTLGLAVRSSSPSLQSARRWERFFRSGSFASSSSKASATSTVSNLSSPSSPSPAKFSSVGTTSNSALTMLAKKASFPTWTFDQHCDTMETNSMPVASIDVKFTAPSIFNEDSSDLIMIGVYAPPSNDDKDGKADQPKSTDTNEDSNVPEPILSGFAAEMDEKLGGAIAEAMMENYKAFQHGAKVGTTLPTLRIVGGLKDDTTQGKKKTQRIVILGLGPEPSNKTIDSTVFSKVGGAIATKCDSESKVGTCSLYLPDSFLRTSTEKTLSHTAVADITSEFYSSLYSDNRYRTGDKVKIIAKDLTSVNIYIINEASSASQEDAATIQAAVSHGKALAYGQFMTKDIVNAPHNVLNSITIANVARQIASESNGRISCTILGKKECEERGMGAYLGVARGSETEPQFIHLTYTPNVSSSSTTTTPTSMKKVAAIGKGLLFDTGGYNIKTAMMELMKFDCGGAAAVLGAARAVAMIAPDNVEAHFIVAACENMISAKAMVPSDVLTASNGKTIEIVNTDAEGRLTLADALVYADKELGCESIIELSTLTGACMISLGKKMSGIWTDNEELAKELEDVSKVTGDKAWRMPLEKEYCDQLESKIADLKNCGDRYGGAITAALFLQEFVTKKKPFAHIDIAGPVWNDKIGGATGYGAKLVTEWIRRQGNK